ncbi:hypothetical protein GCM10017771_69220 [Streptomyces capitiformicae]|uniref:Amidohydrolase 3 domain-containing protein n=1 Tax=Streptomyces capitiformicae TaxID=2014920 RepID=A0A919DII8_9ACTN|nr:hypothetical protein GCM10017771_69220 [Streptomyces capitiformicae]
MAGLSARRTLDLGGATVLPGFIDAHVHLAWAGLKAEAPSVAPSRCADDVLRVVAEPVTRAPAGGWVDFGGYDQRTLDRRLTAADLDAVSAGRKVYWATSPVMPAWSTRRFSTAFRRTWPEPTVSSRRAPWEPR